MTLQEIRKKLDEIDEKIIHLLSERQSYMPRVAEYKKANNMSVDQPEREEEVLFSKSKLAEDLGLDSTISKVIFKTILENSKDIQRKLM